MIVAVQLALICIIFCIIIISMASRNQFEVFDGSVSMTDAEEVEEIIVCFGT